MQIKEYIGSKDFLGLHKTAFLCSRKISPKVVTKCYDWAIEMRDSGKCVISGFHSQIEKDVLYYLLKGNQPIILALGRGMKKRFEPEIKEALNQNRILIITPFEPRIKRVDQKTAKVRNQMMIELADEVIVGDLDEGGSLRKLLVHKDYKMI